MFTLNGCRALRSLSLEDLFKQVDPKAEHGQLWNPLWCWLQEWAAALEVKYALTRELNSGSHTAKVWPTRSNHHFT